MTVPTFPTLSGLMYPAKRSPVWDTVKQKSVGGKATAYPNRNLPLWHYELGYEFLRSDVVNLEWQTLVGFYNQLYGAAYLFQFRDVDDCTALLQSFGAGNAIAVAFQLTRAGNFGFSEPVYCLASAPSIYVNGVLKVLTTDYTVDLTTGIVTFVAAPANGAALTWSGTYNWYARFDDDSAEFEKFAYQFWNLKKITFTTELL